MSSKSTFSNSTSKSYAVALYELSKDESQLEKVETDINGLKKLINESSDFKEMILSPTVTKDEKRNVSLDIKGNQIDYELFVHKIEEQIIPDLDDEFAKTVDPNCKDLKSFKSKLKDNIAENFETEYLKSVNNAIIDYFVNKT